MGKRWVAGAWQSFNNSLEWKTQKYKTQICKNTNMQKHKDTKIQICKNTNMQKHKYAKKILHKKYYKIENGKALVLGKVLIISLSGTTLRSSSASPLSAKLYRSGMNFKIERPIFEEEQIFNKCPQNAHILLPHLTSTWPCRKIYM